MAVVVPVLVWVVKIEVAVVVADDVADVDPVAVADDVAVDVWVEVAVTVLEAEVVAVLVSLVVAVDVAVDDCVSVHASHPTGHIFSTATPKSTVEHEYEGKISAQLSGSNFPLHSPWVVAVVLCELEAVDVPVVVTVVKQLSVAVIVCFVRFCLTIVLRANATLLQVSVFV